MASSSNKDGQFRTAKKIAELTQVVHLLQKRNHELEHYISGMKHHFAEEAERLEARVQEAHMRNNALETESKFDAKQRTQLETLNSMYRSKLDEMQAEATRRHREMDAAVLAERKLREEAEAALGELERKAAMQASQNTLESTRHALSTELMRGELDTLRVNVQAAVSAQVEDESVLRRRETELAGKLAAANRDLARYRAELDRKSDDLKQKDAKYRQLEQELRIHMEQQLHHQQQQQQWRRRMSQKPLGSSLSSGGAKERNLKSQDQSTSKRSVFGGGDMENEGEGSGASNETMQREIEILKDELKRYKLELRNRDETYTKLFSSSTVFPAASNSNQIDLLTTKRSSLIAAGATSTPSTANSTSISSTNVGGGSGDGGGKTLVSVSSVKSSGMTSLPAPSLRNSTAITTTTSNNTHNPLASSSVITMLPPGRPSGTRPSVQRPQHLDRRYTLPNPMSSSADSVPSAAVVPAVAAARNTSRKFSKQFKDVHAF